MNTLRTLLASIAAGALLVGAAGAAAAERSQIRIVGSSTVYPFSSYVAEEFGAVTGFRTPVVESTGSGGGIKLFCAGPALDTPDIANASRRMKPSEFERCADNGVTDITEYQVGYDGIVMAQAASNPAIALTREQITLAVAAQVPVDGVLVANPYRRWNEIDPALPDRAIVIYGPPTTSGTRDAFEELVMEPATEAMAGYGGQAFTQVRRDGVYVDSGENDNLIVQKIEQDTDAFGIFGYGFLEENRRRVAAATVDGVEATPANVSSGDYPVSRSLWFYAKNAHLDRVPGLGDFIEMFLSDMMTGSDGLLGDIGLIALPEDRLELMRERLAARTALTAADLAH